MIKVTYKLKTGEYKSKEIGELELPQIKAKMLDARVKGKIVYWWIEKIINWRKDETKQPAGEGL
jgi:hypothetical protein